MQKKIFCVGGATVDYKLKSLAPLTPATSNPISSSTSFGGVARNVAENLSAWTDEIYLQCVVGADEQGKKLLLYMQGLGVNIDYSFVLKNMPTSSYYAVLDENGKLYIALSDMKSYDAISLAVFTKTWAPWPKGSIVFLDTNLPHHLIEYAINEAKTQEWVLCIDPVSVPKASKLPPSLENVFLLKPNHLEAEALTGIAIHSMSDCFKVGYSLLDRGVKNVVISLSAAGYVVINEKIKEHIPPFNPQQIKDVNGAGDAFIAGILFGLQQELSLLSACQMGAKAATMTIQSHKTVAESSVLKTLGEKLTG